MNWFLFYLEHQFFWKTNLGGEKYKKNNVPQQSECTDLHTACSHFFIYTGLNVYHYYYCFGKKLLPSSTKLYIKTQPILLQLFVLSMANTNMRKILLGLILLDFSFIFTVTGVDSQRVNLNKVFEGVQRFCNHFIALIWHFCPSLIFNWIYVTVKGWKRLKSWSQKLAISQKCVRF